MYDSASSRLGEGWCVKRLLLLHIPSGSRLWPHVPLKVMATLSLLLLYTPPAPVPLSVISAVYPLFCCHFPSHITVQKEISCKIFESLKIPVGEATQALILKHIYL